MLGLAVLFFIGVYLLISLLAIKLAARWARKRGRRGWIWGGIAAFAMYNLVFWDLIPTLVLHKYYCATEAGFWVYKTPEEWVKENPGELETMKPWPRSKIYGDGKIEYEMNGGMVTQYNERFGYWSKSVRVGRLIGKRETGIIDVKSGKLIANYISFISGPRGFGIVWKGWLNSECDVPANVIPIQLLAIQLNMGEL